VPAGELDFASLFWRATLSPSPAPRQTTLTEFLTHALNPSGGART